jgi:hypothetical protein
VKKLREKGPARAFLFVGHGTEVFLISANLATDSPGGWGRTDMAKTFFADMIASSQVDRATSRLEIVLSNAAGHVQKLSLGPDAIATLAAVASELARSNPQSLDQLTKIPKHYAVGHGRHEPVVMLRFEDEPAYGLSVRQAEHLAEALLEEAEAVADAKYCMRQ